MKKENNNSKRAFIIYLVIAIIWLLIIFIFSAKDGHESSETSHFVGMLFGKIFVPGFSKWSFERQDAFAAVIDHPLRKIAHGVEYGILGFLSYMTILNGVKYRLLCNDNKIDFKKFDKFQKRKLLLKIACFSLLFTALYATSDEIHQYFVPGRACKATDVLIDSVGAMIVISISFFCSCKSRKKSI